MTIILSDKNVRDAVDIAALVDDLESGLIAEAGGAILPERMSLDLGSTLFRIMPAILPAAGVLGVKTFHGTLEEGVRYCITIGAINGGEILAVVDAAYLTAARTGATSGVATRRLARADARTIGLIGSGLEAETNLAALCAVRPIEQVHVYSRSAVRRQDFAERMSDRLSLRIDPCDSPQMAVAEADVVLVATNTGRGGTPAFHGAWLRPGQHVVSIGSTAPFLREIDEETFLRSDVVVFDAAAEQVAAESGDVIALVQRSPDWTASGSLVDALAGTVGRDNPDQITLFKSVGTAAQDLLAAQSLSRVAAARGIGLVVGDLAEPKQF